MPSSPAFWQPFAAAILFLVAAIFDLRLISTAISDSGYAIYLRPVATLGFSAWMLLISLSAAKDKENHEGNANHRGVGYAALVAVAVVTVLWLAVDKLA